ncbi:MAG: hypothetical protein CMJ58_07670 [Planctomycetaceae bacterium]|nr:hypothetical protein [Planctomycetaceae bacterium]
MEVPPHTSCSLLFEFESGRLIAWQSSPEAASDSEGHAQSAAADWGPDWANRLWQRREFQDGVAKLAEDGGAAAFELHDDLAGEPVRVEMTLLTSVDSGDVMLVKTIPHSERAEHRVDPLTGIPDRRVLSEVLDRAYQLAPSPAGALVFIDIDEFKPVNDRYGHLAGDLVLQTLTERWAAELRRHDLLTRFGGDEFVLLLAGDLDRPAAKRVAARLQARAADPVEVDGAELRVTISYGVALLGDYDSAEAVIAAADLAMYARKSPAGSSE